MMCQRIGRSPISTIGLGREAVSSDSRVPRPPARMTTFTTRQLPPGDAGWTFAGSVAASSAFGRIAARRSASRRQLDGPRRRTTSEMRPIQVHRSGTPEEQILAIGRPVDPDQLVRREIKGSIRHDGAGPERRPEVFPPGQLRGIGSHMFGPDRVGADPFVAGVNGRRVVPERNRRLTFPISGRIVGEGIRGDDQRGRDEPRECAEREGVTPTETEAAARIGAVQTAATEGSRRRGPSGRGSGRTGRRAG